MKPFANIDTQEELDALPTQFGATRNPTMLQLQPYGYRYLIEEEAIPDGYRVESYRYEDIDGTNARKVIVSKTNIVEENAQIEAEKARLEAERIAQEQAAYIADLQINAQRYIYENAFLLICDMLSGQTEHEKLPMETLSLILLGLRSQDKDKYEIIRDALSMINASLTRCDVKWWDVVKYRDIPEFVQGAQELLGLIQ